MLCQGLVFVRFLNPSMSPLKVANAIMDKVTREQKVLHRLEQMTVLNSAQWCGAGTCVNLFPSRLGVMHRWKTSSRQLWNISNVLSIPRLLRR